MDILFNFINKYIVFILARTIQCWLFSSHYIASRNRYIMIFMKSRQKQILVKYYYENWAFVTVLSPPSVSVLVRQCVSALTFSFQRFLLWNHLLDFDQTSEEWFLPKLFKEEWYVRKAQIFYIWLMISSRCS